jgi:hypothetical protein
MSRTATVVAAGLQASQGGLACITILLFVSCDGSDEMHQLLVIPDVGGIPPTRQAHSGAGGACAAVAAVHVIHAVSCEFLVERLIVTGCLFYVNLQKLAGAGGSVCCHVHVMYVVVLAVLCTDSKLKAGNFNSKQTTEAVDTMYAVCSVVLRVMHVIRQICDCKTRQPPSWVSFWVLSRLVLSWSC